VSVRCRRVRGSLVNLDRNEPGATLKGMKKKVYWPYIPIKGGKEGRQRSGFLEGAGGTSDTESTGGKMEVHRRRTDEQVGKDKESQSI